MARGGSIGARRLLAVAALAAAGLVAAHRNVNQAGMALESAEQRLAAMAGARPASRPPITASISTVASCAGPEILLERCTLEWREAGSLAFVRPELRVAGRAESEEAVDRFVDRLGEHAFLGAASLAGMRPHLQGGVAFEVAIGAAAPRTIESIVAMGGAR
jgi:Tfp pilus assembly protein PilN